MAAVREAWILAGERDGRATMPALEESVAGMPHVVRHACSAKAAGVERIYVIWNAPGAPDIAPLCADSRLHGVTLELVTAMPPGREDDRILVLRADRVFHRDLPKRVAQRAAETAAIVKVRGEAFDSVLAMDRGDAARLACEADLGEAVTRLLERKPPETVDPPWLGFSVAVTDRRSRRDAEKRLVHSLRKAADGFASTYINRHISLFVTRQLAKTPVLPNHVTVVCFLIAATGSWFIARGDYWGGAIGFLFIEMASIFDGIDGELSRLKYRFSRAGQWLDTVVDDLSNVMFILATTHALDTGGTSWALPLGAAALAAFTITQAVQYYFIIKVYHSGDLAAIPWAFQSTEFLEARPTKLVPWLQWAIPRCLKRDFVVTLFFVLAVLGRLDIILLVWAAGSLSFLVIFLIQLARHLNSKSVSAD